MSATHAQPKPTHPLDDHDPHRFHVGEHHGHTIIPARTLLGILLILMVFTVLTVFCSRAEVWISKEFNVHIPQLVNVLVALFIAVVKSALVALYFMQLKYDNPLNGLVFLFCLFALGLFLFFTMTDLGSRAVLYDYKAGEVTKGGMGMDNRNEGTPNYQYAAKQAETELGPEKFNEEKTRAHAGHHEESHESKPPSDASRSRPLRGTTAPAPAHAPPAGGGH